MSDVRDVYVDGREIWRDGTCLRCGSPTFETDARRAEGIKGVWFSMGTKLGKPGAYDYYLWCSNKDCEHHSGECLFDTECPPSWANHVDKGKMP